MPRNIESILDAHHAADERRKAGKPIWDRKLRIKHLLSSDSSDERAVEVAGKIAGVLKASRWYTVETAEAAAEKRASALGELVDELTAVESVDDLNEALDGLYDLADIDRVWIE